MRPQLETIKNLRFVCADFSDPESPFFIFRTRVNYIVCTWEYMHGADYCAYREIWVINKAHYNLPYVQAHYPILNLRTNRRAKSMGKKSYDLAKWFHKYWDESKDKAYTRSAKKSEKRKAIKFELCASGLIT